MGKKTRCIAMMSTILLLAALTLPACSQTTTPDTVRIAVSVPVSLAETLLIPAMEMALDEHEGRAGNVNVEFLILDSAESESNPFSVDMEAEVAAQAAADPTVVGYIGPVTSAQSEVSIPILNQAGITQIGIDPSWPGLTRPGYGAGEPGKYYPTGQRTFFRLVPTLAEAVENLARYIAETGVETIYLTHDGTPYSAGFSGVLEVAARDLELEVLAIDEIDPEATREEIEAQAQRIVDAQPDLLIFDYTNPVTVVDLVVAIRQLDPDLPIAIGEFTDEVNQFAELGLDWALLDGIYHIVVVPAAEHLDNEAAIAFFENYEARYGEPIPHPYALVVYEATNVLLYAIEHAESPTREGVLDAMHDLGEYSGTLGTWQFDANGDIIATGWYRIDELNNGEWETVELIVEEP